MHLPLHDSPDIPPGGPAGLEIRSAGWRDLAAVAGVQRRAFPPRFAYSLSTLAVLWALPWVHLLIARRDGEIVGCVVADRVLDGNRIVNLAVDPSAQRQGIGAALLHAAECALPAGDMTLMVQTGNAAARALYQRVGYDEESVHPHYYGSGNPGIKMRKRRGALRGLRGERGEEGGEEHDGSTPRPSFFVLLLIPPRAKRPPFSPSSPSAEGAPLRAIVPEQRDGGRGGKT